MTRATLVDQSPCSRRAGRSRWTDAGSTSRSSASRSATVATALLMAWARWSRVGHVAARIRRRGASAVWPGSRSGAVALQLALREGNDRSDGPGFPSSHALVAQRIEHRPPEPCAQVRVLPRAPKPGRPAEGRGRRRRQDQRPASNSSRYSARASPSPAGRYSRARALSGTSPVDPLPGDPSPDDPLRRPGCGPARGRDSARPCPRPPSGPAGPRWPCCRPTSPRRTGCRRGPHRPTGPCRPCAPSSATIATTPRCGPRRRATTRAPGRRAPPGPAPAVWRPPAPPGTGRRGGELVPVDGLAHDHLVEVLEPHELVAAGERPVQAEVQDAVDGVEGGHIGPTQTRRSSSVRRARPWTWRTVTGSTG